MRFSPQIHSNIFFWIYQFDYFHTVFKVSTARLDEADSELHSTSFWILASSPKIRAHGLLLQYHSGSFTILHECLFYFRFF